MSFPDKTIFPTPACLFCLYSLPHASGMVLNAMVAFKVSFKSLTGNVSFAPVAMDDPAAIPPMGLK